MELKFFINNAPVDSPINWDEIDANIEFDPVNQITTISHESNMKWNGDVYNDLFNTYLNGSICTLFDFELKAEIDNAEVSIFKGKINVAKCSFNERQRVVTVPIVDDSYGARIENNKSAKISLDVTQTKNGQSISCNSVDLQVFISSSGNYLVNLRRAYTVYDAFDFLISWMSDNTIGFRSDFFNPSLANDGANDYLLSGVDLRTGNAVSAPKFSFLELFDLMRRVRNIGMGFQKDSNGNPIVRIEEIDFFRSNIDTVSFLDVNETELSFEQSVLYTTVKVGSDILKKSDCSTICNASNNVSYFGFEVEYYTLNGECTNEAELTLTIDNPFIVDTNKIQEAVEFFSDINDDKVFLIHKDPFSSVEASQSDPLGIGENWYNEAYTNKEVIGRYQDYLSGTLNLYNLYSNFNLCYYDDNQPSGVLSPNAAPSYLTYPATAGTGIPTADIVYDPQSSFNISNGRFYPVKEGVYKFCVGAAIDEFGNPPPAITVFWYLQIEHYDSGNTLINTYQSDVRSYLTSAAANFEEWESPFIPMDSGDYVIFNASYAQQGDPAVVGQATVFIGGSSPEIQYFKCCESYVAIQDNIVNNGDKRQLAITSFDCPIPINDFRTLFDDTTQRIRVTSLNLDRTGYINSFRYNVAKGNAEISIVSNG